MVHHRHDEVFGDVREPQNVYTCGDSHSVAAGVEHL